jgi:hypothetical protein
MRLTRRSAKLGQIREKSEWRPGRGTVMAINTWRYVERSDADAVGRREVVKDGGVGVTRQIVSVTIRAKTSVYSD